MLHVVTPLVLGDVECRHGSEFSFQESLYRLDDREIVWIGLVRAHSFRNRQLEQYGLAKSGIP